MKRRLLTTAAAVAAAAALSSAGTTTAQPQKGTPTPPCEKAKHVKPGTGFMCDLIYVPKAKTRGVVARIEAGATQEAALATAGGDAGTCSLTGCYDWFTNLHAGYDAVGSYSWRYSNGAFQRIGTITVDLDDFLINPYATKVSPFCWSTTHSAPSVRFIIELYWATTGGSSGELANRKRAISPYYTVLGKKCMPSTGMSNGYGGSATNILSDTTRGIYLNYHFVRWGAAGFPGHWWLYNKSWIYGKSTAGSPLKFYSPVKWPVYANDAGWLPS